MYRNTLSHFFTVLLSEKCDLTIFCFSVAAMEICKTPKRRRLEPAFMNEVRTPDLATPRRAKRSFMLAKSQAEKWKRKSRALEQKILRLSKKSEDTFRFN